MNRFLYLVFSLFITVGIASPSMAQDQQETENSMLPEIDPQDIEIRSQFQARFPGLRRQPILGFDPKPRVYQIDPDRTPFMETDDQVIADLPVSELTRPDPPPYTPLPYASDINAFGRLGFGSYISPEAQFWGVKRLNPKRYIGGDLDFSSSDGHLENQESSFRFFDANAEFVTKLNEQSQLAFDGGIESSFNDMFNLPQTNIPNSARKEYSSFNLGADFQRFKNTVTGWKMDANIRYYDASLNSATDLSGTSEERVYGGSVAKRWTGGNVSETFAIKAGARGGNYTNPQHSDEWLTAQGGVEYERLFNYSTKVKVDASVYYGTDNFESKIYIGPSVTIEHPLLDILTLTIKGNAEPYVKTVEQLHTNNRFLNVGNELRHSYRINGQGEASLEYANHGRLNLGIQYENTSDQPIFARELRFSGTQQLFYETNYVDTYNARAYASVVHQIIPDRFTVSGKVYLQSPQIQNEDRRIPFEEKIGVNSGISVRPIDKITFEAWADYVGSRKTYHSNEKLDGFFLLGGQADVEITDRFGAYIKLVNLLDQNYEVWQGYTERPFQAYGGITVKL